MMHLRPDAPGTSTGRQLTLWPSPAAQPEGKLRRPSWHRISPLSVEAARRAEPRAGTRKAHIPGVHHQSGTKRRHSRGNLSRHPSLPIQSVCSPVRALIDQNCIVETARQDPLRLGSPAAVLVASSCDGG
jgi:hypothetical protein